MMSIDRRRWLKAKLEVAPHPAYRLRKLRLYVSAPSPSHTDTGQSLVKGWGHQQSHNGNNCHRSYILSPPLITYSLAPISSPRKSHLPLSPSSDHVAFFAYKRRRRTVVVQKRRTTSTDRPPTYLYISLPSVSSVYRVGT